MSKDIRPQIFYYVRRGWYGQLTQLCESTISKKGKDPSTVFWLAFASGMQGNIQDALNRLETLQSRKDLQLPMIVAMIYFHQKAANVDREMVRSLKGDLSVAETVTKEAGLLLAARFHLYVENYSEARAITRRLVNDLSRQSNATNVFEVEAHLIDAWCTVEEAAKLPTAEERRRVVCELDTAYSSNGRAIDLQDLDSLMCWARVKLVKGLTQEALGVLNQAIATSGAFLPALADKALLLATAGDWDQALDSAQRLLDADAQHLDAHTIISVHAFTQECQPHDAIQKLEELEQAMTGREPHSVSLALHTAALFSSICSRQPRALQICHRLLDKMLPYCKHVREESRVLCEVGNVHLKQGSAAVGKAVKAFREATKRDASNIKALLGLIHCQLLEGQVEDAESQLEVLSLMHTEEDLGHAVLYLLALTQQHQREKQFAALTKCAQFLSRWQSTVSAMAAYDVIPVELGGRTPFYLSAFWGLFQAEVDFSLVLTQAVLDHLEVTSLPSTLLPAGTSSASMLTSSLQESEDPSSASTAEMLSSSSPSAEAGSQGLLDSEEMTASLTSLEVSPALQLAAPLVQRILVHCPANLPAYLLLARAYASLGYPDDSSRLLSQALSYQPQSSAVLVMLALGEASRHRTVAAERYLDQALAVDFAIRSLGKFKLVKAIVRGQQGRSSEAVQELEGLVQSLGLNLADLLGSSSSSSSSAAEDSKSGGAASALSSSLSSTAITSYSDVLVLTEDDRVTALVLLATLLAREHRTKEGHRLLAHAKVLFAGAPQEVAVLVASAGLYVEKGDYDSAVRVLDKVRPDAKAFARAQVVKADILLRYNHDREGYTRCFQELAQREPTARNFVLLGDSFLRILNTEAAIDALERAYKLDPQNSRLRAKIGRALVSTHEYHRAVEFYESALRELSHVLATAQRNANPPSASASSSSSGHNPAVTISSERLLLAHALAKLYIKLNRLEAAERVLHNILHDPPVTAVEYSQNILTYGLIIAVQRKQRIGPEGLMSSLLTVHDAYKAYFGVVRGNSMMGVGAESLEEMKRKMADLCNELAVECLALHRTEDVDVYLQEATSYDPHNTRVMLTVARVLRGKKQWEQCQVACQKIVTIGKGQVKDALLLLSEVLLLVSDAEAAVQPLLDFLNTATTSGEASFQHFDLLDPAIGLLRRAGKLTEAKNLLMAIEKRDKRYLSQPGYHYCSGLYYRYVNDIGRAVREFNLCRRDDHWAGKALIHMVELYLNPDQDGIWEEREAGPVDDNTRANVATAEHLLRELKPLCSDPNRVVVLEAYVAMCTRTKVAIDRSIAMLGDLLEQDTDYLPAVLGMATAFMIDRQQHKARNLLKRVGRLDPCIHDGEDFEKANLLLAKFYIDKGRMDQAQEVCKKLLQQNKSCSQAWELLGLIFEKNANYDLASDAYQKAWVLEFEASASVGFKLAFSLLKCRRLVEAVDVCATVLKQYPDYPRIQEEILQKALHAMRTTAPVV